MTRGTGSLRPAGGPRFEALAVTAQLWSDPRVRLLLAELARTRMSTAILGARSERVRAIKDGLSRDVRAHASAATVDELVELWWSEGIRASEAVVLGAADSPQNEPPAALDHSADTGAGEGSGEPGAGGPTWLAVTPSAACAVMSDQLRRREGLDLPAMPAESSWTVVVDGVDAAREPTRDVRLAMVDGVTGTLGSPLVDYSPARRDVYVAGVYRGTGAETNLIHAPDWTRLAGHLDDRRPVRRILDLRTGLVHHDLATEFGPVRAVSFASRARPGIGVLRAGGKGARSPRSGLLANVPSLGGPTPTGDATSRGATARLRGASGGLAIAARETKAGRGESRRLERVVAARASGHRTPSEAAARSFLAEAADIGFDRLLAEQRSAWASRWADADIRIEGDPALQRAIRFALFELIAHAPDRGEAAIGARGLTGGKYRGHVFWDTDVFVLPFLAATNPRAARAILEYRVRRLDAARAAARESGFAGAWFPWESAGDGRDVTPSWIMGGDGLPLQVLTGEHELHIVSDVAWAAATYADWTGDRAFASGPGGELLFETARFWASRFERAADGSAHLSGVIGPDEYHNMVADNAFTNVMARWNLRRAATWGEAAGPVARSGTGPIDSSAAPSAAERAAWLELASRIVDGFDPASGLYEQFDGFFALEPVRIVELTTRPVSGEVFLGRERVARAQCVKQPDVLMLYHLVPDELEPGTLAANLDFYDPRTAHGSSLSPGIHAALMARAGRTEEALAALRLAAFIDLNDDFHRTAEGLHVATMGSLWQAIVLGFAGLRPAGDELAIDPHLPSGWRALELPFRLQDRRVRVRLEHDRLELWAERPVTIRVAGAPPVVAGRDGPVLVRRGERWSPSG
jgi:trehalose/maltose hydrolase-like predicted phosphorylase